jgi:hypothetical protein
MSGAERVALERLMHPILRNWNGIEVGALRPAETIMA